jgi:hypothetical protein
MELKFWHCLTLMTAYVEQFYSIPSSIWNIRITSCGCPRNTACSPEVSRSPTVCDSIRSLSNLAGKRLLIGKKYVVALITRYSQQSRHTVFWMYTSSINHWVSFIFPRIRIFLFVKVLCWRVAILFRSSTVFEPTLRYFENHGMFPVSINTHFLLLYLSTYFDIEYRTIRRGSALAFLGILGKVAK